MCICRSGGIDTVDGTVLNSIIKTMGTKLKDTAIVSTQRIEGHFFPGDARSILQFYNMLVCVSWVKLKYDRAAIPVFGCKYHL